jgi:hypothetical protein
MGRLKKIIIFTIMHTTDLLLAVGAEVAEAS